MLVTSGWGVWSGEYIGSGKRKVLVVSVFGEWGMVRMESDE